MRMGSIARTAQVTAIRAVSPIRRATGGKSCKGCLYYSSRLKSDGHNPVCVGIGRTLPQDIGGQKNFNCWSYSCKC
uniref:DUF8204 domain-containing protein n=1 Tax=Musa acuminata subsp. malaccensis TaxID=214687 RepID=A0A804IU60_MUSAM